MFELKYDILDDLDAKTVNVQELSDRITPEDEYIVTIPEFHQKLIDTECSHLLVVCIQKPFNSELPNVDLMRSSLNLIVHRFFGDDVPDVQVTYGRFDVIDMIRFITDMTYDDFCSWEEHYESLKYEHKNTPSVVLKIPVKLPLYKNEHQVNKMLNFAASMRAAYLPEAKKVNMCGQFLLYKLFEDGPYEKAERADSLSEAYEIKFNNDNYHIDNMLNVCYAAKSMYLFFNDKECVAETVQKWSNKYYSRPLSNGMFTAQQMENYIVEFKQKHKFHKSVKLNCFF